jgi:hypothetical protein
VTRQTPLTQAELNEALMPLSEWLATREPVDRVLDVLTFTPKPGDRDVLLWIAPALAVVGIVYVVAHLIVAAVTG